MEERFRGKERHAGALLFLVPTVMLTRTEECQEHIEGMLYWERDLPFPKSLGSELRRWQALWQHKDDREGGKTSKIPNNLLLSLGACDIDSFPNIHRLLVIASTLPITSAEAELSFSLMRRIKIYDRSVLTEEHLSDQVVIVMHYSERIPIEEIYHAFVQSNPRRLFQASML